MNIAIIIGVSIYLDTKNNLPGCKNDAKAIYNIIQKTEKFETILYINENETSSKTKELIANFIFEHKDSEIEELFFYYSGHGSFENDEFYYILSDFNPKKRNQTSLQNGEIDDLIRTLKPNLVTKIIDACQSGVAYIKESNVITKYFNETKSGFNKCYFLNSSLNDQSSFQDDTISFFTLSFINALKENDADEIRYKSIIDYISDEFYGIPEQTPFFVIQADYTEKFCTLTKNLKEYLDSFSLEIKETEETKGKKISIIELVKKDSIDYADKKRALETLDFVKTEFEKIKLNKDIADLYTVKISFLEAYQTVSKKSVIGKWIDDSDKAYFAKSTYEKVADNFRSNNYINPIKDYNKNQNYLSLAELSLSAFTGKKTIDDISKYKLQINGFEQNIEVPFKTISIDFIGNFPNLLSYNCKIIFLLSLKNIRFFYFITNYIIENWDNRKINTSDLDWITSEFKITDNKSILLGINEIKGKFETRINKDLIEKFKIVISKEITIA